VASVMASLGRVGARARISGAAADVEGAGLVLVPGVGAFAAAMGALREQGVDRVIAERVRAGRATLGICLGMQVMFEGSEESPGVEGLGVVEGRVERFGQESQISNLKSQRGGSGCPGQHPVVRVPQMGWNGVEVVGSTGWSEQHPVARESRIIVSGAAYFANSYRVAEAPEGWRVAVAEHGGRFVAGMERGAVVLCQFHPELSGAWGLGLIRRWIKKVLEGRGLGGGEC
jgi:imidazoleglycerol phosphate synthase glutamine amidotransferase subunit HisH